MEHRCPGTTDFKLLRTGLDAPRGAVLVMLACYGWPSYGIRCTLV